MLATAGFVIATPFTFYVRSRKLIKRRNLIYAGLSFISIAMIMRTGNLLGREKQWMIYVFQVVNGFGVSILTVCTFPEMVDCVEQREDYNLYNKEKMQVYLSGFSVLVSNVGYVIGSITGSLLADFHGYAYAFLTGGIVVFAFTGLYGFFCGSGEYFADDN